MKLEEMGQEFADGVREWGSVTLHPARDGDQNEAALCRAALAAVALGLGFVSVESGAVRFTPGRHGQRRAKILEMLAFIDWHTNQADTEALYISPWDPEESDNAGEARALNQASLSDREIRYAAHEIGAALGFTSEEIVAAEERLRREDGDDAIRDAAAANPVARRLAGQVEG